MPLYKGYLLLSLCTSLMKSSLLSPEAHDNSAAMASLCIDNDNDERGCCPLVNDLMNIHNDSSLHKHSPL